MTQETETEVPKIDKVQYNVDGAEHSFEGEENVEQEYKDNINHDGPAVRIVLENGNWIEYRKLNDDTMQECAFKQIEQPTGHREAMLEDDIEVEHLEIPNLDEFFKAVNTSIEVYQLDMETIEDVEVSWTTILPAVQD